MPSALSAARAGSRRTFVLIHGAWHGGWCWDLVRASLTRQGRHRVFAPTLSGLGHGAAPLTPATGLDMHIADVTRLIDRNDLRDIILVGHSYGGMVVTGVVDQMKDRIAHIVYLDAAVPENGRSMITYGPEKPAAVIEAVTNGLRALALDGVGMRPLPPEAFGIPKDHPRYDWVQRNLRPHPFKSWTDPITLKNDGSAGVVRTYIHCVAPVLQQTNFPWLAKRVRTDSSWRYAELQTGHDAMITAPSDVARLLLNV